MPVVYVGGLSPELCRNPAAYCRQNRWHNYFLFSPWPYRHLHLPPAPRSRIRGRHAWRDWPKAKRCQLFLLPNRIRANYSHEPNR